MSEEGVEELSQSSGFLQEIGDRFKALGDRITGQAAYREKLGSFVDSLEDIAAEESYRMALLMEEKFTQEGEPVPEEITEMKKSAGETLRSHGIDPEQLFQKGEETASE